MPTDVTDEANAGLSLKSIPDPYNLSDFLTLSHIHWHHDAIHHIMTKPRELLLEANQVRLPNFGLSASNTVINKPLLDIKLQGLSYGKIALTYISLKTHVLLCLWDTGLLASE